MNFGPSGFQKVNQIWGWLTACIFFFYLNSLKSQESVKQHLNPLKLLFTLENIMSNNSIIVADGGDFVGTAAYILRYWQSLGLALFKVMQKLPSQRFWQETVSLLDVMWHQSNQE